VRLWLRRRRLLLLLEEGERRPEVLALAVAVVATLGVEKWRGGGCGGAHHREEVAEANRWRRRVLIGRGGKAFDAGVTVGRGIELHPLQQFVVVLRTPTRPLPDWLTREEISTLAKNTPSNQRELIKG
jgi:hypothetical protein